MQLSTEEVSKCPASTGELDFLWLELTDKCNLTCVHCYADSGPRLPLLDRMQLPEWQRALREGQEAGCRKVQFIGGEPALHPHLIDLIQYSRELGYELVEVFTNGTVLTEPLKDALRQFCVHLAFSVYGDTAQIHDPVTRQVGSFARTMRSIEWALAAGLSVRVGITEMEENASSVDAARQLFEEMGVREVRVDRRRGVGRGSLVQNLTPSFHELCGACWEGKLCISPSGDIYPCVFSRSWVVGSAGDGVHAALAGHPLREFRSSLRAMRSNESAECGPARDPGNCNPDTQCNPDRGLTRSAVDRVERKCNPHVEKCVPSRHSSISSETERKGCNPRVEERTCAPARRAKIDSGPQPPARGAFDSPNMGAASRNPKSVVVPTAPSDDSGDVTQSTR